MVFFKGKSALRSKINTEISIKLNLQEKVLFSRTDIQGQPLGIDIMYLVLADRNMQVRFGFKVVWES